MTYDRTQVTFQPLRACGQPVKIDGETVGFCERQADHDPLPHTHVLSDFAANRRGFRDILRRLGLLR